MHIWLPCANIWETARTEIGTDFVHRDYMHYAYYCAHVHITACSMVPMHYCIMGYTVHLHVHAYMFRFMSCKYYAFMYYNTGCNYVKTYPIIVTVYSVARSYWFSVTEYFGWGKT